MALLTKTKTRVQVEYFLCLYSDMCGHEHSPQISKIRKSKKRVQQSTTDEERIFGHLSKFELEEKDSVRCFAIYYRVDNVSIKVIFVTIYFGILESMFYNHGQSGWRKKTSCSHPQSSKICQLLDFAKWNILQRQCYLIETTSSKMKLFCYPKNYFKGTS